MTDPLALEHKDFYPAFRQGGTRMPQDVSCIVIHSTEGVVGNLGAEATAAYFHSPAAMAGTQLVVDDDSTQRCIDDLRIPAGVPPLNTHGLHIEQSGHAAWSVAEWLSHESMIDRCAFKVAEWCAKFDIPAVWLSVADLVAAPGFPQPSPKGITSHANVTAAFGQSTHTDPGPNYPYDLFMAKVKAFLNPPPPPEDPVTDADVAKIVAGVTKVMLPLLTETRDYTLWSPRLVTELNKRGYSLPKPIPGEQWAAALASVLADAIDSELGDEQVPPTGGNV
jgi:hypothetical protein